MRPRVVALGSLALVLGASACKYDLDKGEEKKFCKVSTSAAVCKEAEDMNVSDFAWLQTNMFSTNCSGKDCHGAPMNGVDPAGRLILAEGYAYKTLMGSDPGTAPPLVDSELTGRHKLVQPFEPEASYLFFMLKGIAAENGLPRFEAPPEDVGYMPQSNNTLCCQKLEAVRRWIEAGALP